MLSIKKTNESKSDDNRVITSYLQIYKSLFCDILEDSW